MVAAGQSVNEARTCSQYISMCSLSSVASIKGLRCSKSKHLACTQDICGRTNKPAAFTDSKHSALNPA